jgi:nicotinamidase-related amidase
MPHPRRMSAADTGLLVVDVQEKLMALIPGGDRLVGNIAFLIDAARSLGMTVQATEQYPRGLGPTAGELARRIPERPDKVSFSCCAVPAVVGNFDRAGRPKVLLAGIEAHVCVLQTALDLLARDLQVFVAADAVASRYAIDQEVALRRLEREGAVVTTSEAAVFEWIGGADHPHFKDISRLVQDRMKWLGK